MTEYCVCFVTVPDLNTGKAIAKRLIADNLCACVNLSEHLASIYMWKENIEENSEVLLTIKTRKSLVESIDKRLKMIHPYEVYELIALPIIAGNSDYLEWINSSTNNPDEKL